MEEKIKNNEIENYEYEEVKHMSLGAFICVGLAFGLAIGFSVGNFIATNLSHIIPFGFAGGMGACLILGAIGGLFLGIINNRKIKK